MIVGKLSKKGQISIPKKIREQFDLKPGDPVTFKVQFDKIVIEKINIKDNERKLSDILLECGPVELDSLNYQKKLRDEWK